MAEYEPPLEEVSRRRFLELSARMTGMTTVGLAAAISLKTDALARPVVQGFRVRENGLGAMPYPYMNP